MAWISRVSKPFPMMAVRRKRSVKLSFPPLKAIAIGEFPSKREKSKRAFLQALSSFLPREEKGGREVGISIKYYFYNDFTM